MKALPGPGVLGLAAVAFSTTASPDIDTTFDGGARLRHCPIVRFVIPGL